MTKHLFPNDLKIPLDAVVKTVGLEWSELLLDLFNTSSVVSLGEEIKKLRSELTPDRSLLFKPFELAPNDIKMIIVSPAVFNNYNSGLGFGSFRSSIYHQTLFKPLGELDPTLVNLHKAGVFFWNYIPTGTVQQNSWSKYNYTHSNLGWQNFSKELINIISKFKYHKVFVLIGMMRNELYKVIDKNEYNLIITGNTIFYKENPIGYENLIEANNWLKLYGRSIF